RIPYQLEDARLALEGRENLPRREVVQLVFHGRISLATVLSAGLSAGLRVPVEARTTAHAPHPPPLLSHRTLSPRSLLVLSSFAPCAMPCSCTWANRTYPLAVWFLPLRAQA